MSDDNRSESPLSSADWAKLRVGARFVVRHQLVPTATHRFTDAVGTAVTVTPSVVDIDTRRHGTVRILREQATAIKEIPTTPGRRGRPHLAIGIDDLERLAVDGWVPSEQATMGAWILRSAKGYTNRANSALAVGRPDLPLAQTLSQVTAWYAARGQSPLIQVPLAPRTAPEADPLIADALLKGWEWFHLTDVLTASTQAVLEAAEPITSRGPEASIGTEKGLCDAWWSLADAQMLEHPEAARSVLLGSLDQEFFVASVHGTPVARGRAAFSQGWAGISALATDREFRGCGLEQQLVDACAEAARRRGLASLYAQVSVDDAATRSLYTGRGFTQHHQYVYLRPQQRSRDSIE